MLYKIVFTLLFIVTVILQAVSLVTGDLFKILVSLSIWLLFLFIILYYYELKKDFELRELKYLRLLDIGLEVKGAKKDEKDED